MERRYRHLVENLSRMTLTEAFMIHNYLFQLEFPTIFHAASGFSLLKTYGIPSISKILVGTRQLTSQGSLGSKRMADTKALLFEALLNHPTSHRAVSARARINYIHTLYSIRPDDMLYTLSLFALEPARWTDRFEWRKLTDLELCALGVFWKKAGEDFGVVYSSLPSGMDGWEDGKEWLMELDDWSRSYEEAYMVPADANKILADVNIERVLWNVPSGLKGLFKLFVTALLEERLRCAMKLPDPPWVIHTILSITITIRKAALHRLCLPRNKIKNLPLPSAPNGKVHLLSYRKDPWYVKPTRKNRWGLKALLIRLKGGKIPGDDGSTYAPEGFVSKEVGPDVAKDSDQAMDKLIEKLAGSSKGSECPFFLA